MGTDPKPSKRRRPPTTSLPMLPLHPAVSPQQHRGHTTSPQAPSQAPLPSGLAYETAVSITALHNALEHMAGIDPDGYFKATTGDDGKSWYLAWRWQRGEWAGHYVMARVLRGEVPYGLQLLADKVEAVRGGFRKPTRDRYGE